MDAQKCETCGKTGECRFEAPVKQILELLGREEGTSFVPGCVAKRLYEEIGGCLPQDPDTAADGSTGDAAAMDMILRDTGEKS